MDHFPIVPAFAKPSQYLARRLWVILDLPTAVIQALFPPHNLRYVSQHIGVIQALGKNPQQVFARLEGTR